MRLTSENRECFKKSAAEVAKYLIGKMICRRLDDETMLRFRITETEAYDGRDDSACYGKTRKTHATSPLFGESDKKAGGCCFYANMLLIACGREADTPDNVLIRSAGNEQQYCKGPILLCNALKIDTKLRGTNLLDPGSPLWIEDDGAVRECCTAERIGLGKSVTEKDRKKKYRFISV